MPAFSVTLGSVLFQRLYFKHIKVKLVLCLNNQALRQEDVWGSGNVSAPFLASAPVGGEQSASRPDPFTPG
jgi:hypothetical protein